jgi:hypothetical protein
LLWFWGFAGNFWPRAWVLLWGSVEFDIHDFYCYWEVIISMNEGEDVIVGKRYMKSVKVYEWVFDLARCYSFMCVTMITMRIVRIWVVS